MNAEQNDPSHLTNAPPFTFLEGVFIKRFYLPHRNTRGYIPSVLFHLIRKQERDHPLVHLALTSMIPILTYFLTSRTIPTRFFSPWLTALLVTLVYHWIWTFWRARGISRKVINGSFYNDLRCTGITFSQMRHDIRLFIYTRHFHTFPVILVLISNAMTNITPLVLIFLMCGGFILLPIIFLTMYEFSLVTGMEKGFYEPPDTGKAKPGKKQRVEIREIILDLLAGLGLIVGALLFVVILMLFAVWDRPLITLIFLIIYIKAAIFAFLIYRHKTRHPPLDVDDITDELKSEEYKYLKEEERLARIEEILSGRF